MQLLICQDKTSDVHQVQYVLLDAWYSTEPDQITENTHYSSVHLNWTLQLKGGLKMIATTESGGMNLLFQCMDCDRTLHTQHNLGLCQACKQRSYSEHWKGIFIPLHLAGFCICNHFQPTLWLKVSNFNCLTLPDWTYLYHLMDIAFRPSKLCRILDFDEYNEVQIVPHVVLGSDVLLKCYILVVKCL